MLTPTELRRRAAELEARADALSERLAQPRVKNRGGLAFSQVARRAEAALLRQLAAEIEANEARAKPVDIVN
jgi:hypothetical protein